MNFLVRHPTDLKKKKPIYLIPHLSQVTLRIWIRSTQNVHSLRALNIVAAREAIYCAFDETLLDDN